MLLRLLALLFVVFTACPTTKTPDPDLANTPDETNDDSSDDDEDTTITGTTPDEKIAGALALLTADALKGDNPDLAHVTSTLTLPSELNGVTITWSASEPAIDVTGAVVRPTCENGTVTLTATLSLSGGASQTKSFEVIVIADDSAAVALLATFITFDFIKGANESESNITTDFNLPTGSMCGVSLTWESSSIHVTSTGHVFFPYDGEPVVVTLSAHISRGDAMSTAPLTLTLPLSAFSCDTWALLAKPSTVDGYAYGEGAEPRWICNADHLVNIHAGANNQLAHILGANIDLAGVAWAPLAALDGSITGAIRTDGSTYEIRNLLIDRPNGSSVGFADHLNGTIANLTLSAATVNGQNSVGILAGESTNGHFTDITVSGTVSGNYATGGLIGSASGVTVTHVVSSVTAIKSASAPDRQYYGGIIGIHQNNGEILGDSEFTGQIEIDDATYIGGIVGKVDAAKITDAHGNGTTRGGNYIGGIAGHAFFASSIKDCDSAGSVTSVLGTSGGIVGNSSGANSASNRPTIQNCSFNGDVNGPYDVGGIVGSMQGGRIVGCTVDGDVTTTSSAATHIGCLAGNVATSLNIHQNTIERSVGACAIHATGDSVNAVGGAIGYAAASETNHLNAGTIEISDCYAMASFELSTTATNVGGFVGELSAEVSAQPPCCGTSTCGGGGNQACTPARADVQRSFSVSNVPEVATQEPFSGLSSGGFTSTACFWDEDVFAGTSTGSTGPGAGKTTAEMQTQATFVGYDFSDVWSITTGEYPTLR